MESAGSARRVSPPGVGGDEGQRGGDSEGPQVVGGQACQVLSDQAGPALLLCAGALANLGAWTQATGWRGLVQGEDRERQTPPGGWRGLHARTARS